MKLVSAAPASFLPVAVSLQLGSAASACAAQSAKARLITIILIGVPFPVEAGHTRRGFPLPRRARAGRLPLCRLSLKRRTIVGPATPQQKAPPKSGGACSSAEAAG